MNQQPKEEQKPTPPPVVKVEQKPVNLTEQKPSVPAPTNGLAWP